MHYFNILVLPRRRAYPASCIRANTRPLALSRQTGMRVVEVETMGKLHMLVNMSPTKALGRDEKTLLRVQTNA
jgi:hypothetical protein